MLSFLPSQVSWNLFLMLETLLVREWTMTFVCSQN